MDHPTFDEAGIIPEPAFPQRNREFRCGTHGPPTGTTVEGTTLLRQPAYIRIYIYIHICC
jgi:hypothetical protein